jgi:hypothetical protein
MEDLLPNEYYLSQNFPNPFKEKTVVKYCLPEEIRIKLEIFNSEKEKIKTLVDEIKEPGTYQVEFKPNGLDEGLYLYQMIAGSLVLTKKMVLMK